MRVEAVIVALCALVFLYLGVVERSAPPALRFWAVVVGVVALSASVALFTYAHRLSVARAEFERFRDRAKQGGTVREW